MYLVVGLGNPGLKYKNTWHNLGFLCIDYISQEHNISVDKVKFRALIGEGFINGIKVILAKPQTYMNLSGESVREISQYYNIEPKNIIILYDDINLSLGKIRVRSKGSAGGHNGLKSIIFHLNTDDFPRLRLGIKNEGVDLELVDYVLSKIPKSDKETIFSCIKSVSTAVEYIINNETDRAMNDFN